MGTVTFELDKGLSSAGGKAHTTCVMREATAGDVFEANAESEKVVIVPTSVDADGNATASEAQLVTSPSSVSLHRLRRQIVSLGELKGPLEAEQLFKLSADDLYKLQEKAEQLDQAKDASQGVTHGGRDDSAGADPA